MNVILLKDYTYFRKKIIIPFKFKLFDISYLLTQFVNYIFVRHVEEVPQLKIITYFLKRILK